MLVIDDDPTVRDLMERFLDQEGFSVVHRRGRRRRRSRLARELRPAAITLDVMMPDLDGWTVLAALKGDPELADIPVDPRTIVDEKNLGYALGAADYLAKPIDRERLARVLAQASARWRLARRAGRRGRRRPRASACARALERDGWRVAEAEQRPRRRSTRLREAVPTSSCST